MNTNDLRIYIILVNYSGHKDTIECLESLFKLKHQNFSIIVVDNSEDDSSLNFIKKWVTNGVFMAHNCLNTVNNSDPLKFILFNEGGKETKNEPLVFIKADKNDGFAAANNIAIKYIQSQYDWLWILNNDTIVPENCLALFNNYASLKCDPLEGIIGTNLYHYNNPDKLQGIGGIYNKWLATSKNLVPDLSDRNIWISQFYEKVDYVIGASMFVSFKFIKEVGLMNERYFLYYEEIDWATRGKKQGYKLGYAIDCNVYHKEGASIGTDFNPHKRSMLSDYYNLRNKIVFTKQFFPLLLPTVYVSLIVSLFLRIYRFQFKSAKMVMKIIINSFAKSNISNTKLI